MIQFEFNPSTAVLFGEGQLDRLGEQVLQLGGRRPLIVTDPGIVAAGHVERARASIEQHSIPAAIFEDVEENPTTIHVDRGLAFARAQEIDLIVALGGGSAMDCAKGINFLYTNGGKMEDYWGKNKAPKPMLPSIGIPTTAGTGSEAQSFALISHAETHRKMACGDRKARFRTVILDPKLLVSVPADVAAVTGMDAISHALESYVTSARNPVSQMYAAEAWRLLQGNFERVLADRSDTAAWGNMMMGAHFSGMAIENSMLGAAHACANPLTANFGTTHGIAVGVMLPAVIRYNSETEAGLYGQLMAAGSNGVSATEKVEQLIGQLAALREAAGIPARLRDIDVPEDMLETLAGQAAEQWTGNFNPRKVGPEELLSIYQAAW